MKNITESVCSSLIFSKERIKHWFCLFCITFISCCLV